MLWRWLESWQGCERLHLLSHQFNVPLHPTNRPTPTEKMCIRDRFEPSDSQEAYDFTLQAIAASERWRAPVLLRLTTRVCHSKTLVQRAAKNSVPAPLTPHYEPDLKTQVMIPAYARPAHYRLRARLAEIAEWNEQHGPNQIISGPADLGIDVYKRQLLLTLRTWS